MHLPCPPPPHSSCTIHSNSSNKRLSRKIRRKVPSDLDALAAAPVHAVAANQATSCREWTTTEGDDDDRKKFARIASIPFYYFSHFQLLLWPTDLSSSNRQVVQLILCRQSSLLPPPLCQASLVHTAPLIDNPFVLLAPDPASSSSS